MASQNEKIGARVCQARRMQGVTQEGLAEMVDCSVQFISLVETGKRGISVQMLCLLANALQVSADDLLGIALESASATDWGFHALLMDCSERERRVMLDVAESVKRSLRKNR